MHCLIKVKEVKIMYDCSAEEHKPNSQIVTLKLNCDLYQIFYFLKVGTIFQVQNKVLCSLHSNKNK